VALVLVSHQDIDRLVGNLLRRLYPQSSGAPFVMRRRDPRNDPASPAVRHWLGSLGSRRSGSASYSNSSAICFLQVVPLSYQLSHAEIGWRI
jgi:hypothetical protein